MNQDAGARTLVGRADEIEILNSGAEEAATGRGGVWLIAGEPGIGKSRLADEFAATAGERVFEIHWGRCWEVGGAPAYWPWIQILRTLIARPDASELVCKIGTGGTHLAQLVPEVAALIGNECHPPKLDPDQARFQLMDSIVGILRAATRQEPLALILEDLHAADPASVVMLDFLARQVQSMGLMVIATYREGETHHEPTGPLLHKVARQARTIRLRPLSREEIAEYLAHSVNMPPSPRTVELVFSTTEGNPLYLGEIVDLLLARGGLDKAGEAIDGVTVPDTVKAAIKERAATLSTPTRDMLADASILGREFRATEVAELIERRLSDVEEALGEAARGAIVVEAGAGRYRFVHILTREVFHSGLDGERRRELHLRWSEKLQLQAGDGVEAPLSELAHHLSEAGPEARSRAVDASIHAARQACAQIAFDDAAELYTKALALFSQIPGADSKRRCELLLELAEARMAAGAVEAGRETCHTASELATSLGNGELMARAALTYGSIFVYGEVNMTLVSMLRKAAEALGDEESGLRARVLARLAAAMQPAPDPKRPIELARQAITMARRVGDSEVLLQTIRAGCSAMMDLADPAERFELNQEHVSLAESLNDPIEALRGHMRSVIDALELGQLAAVDRAIAACARTARTTDLPHHLWPVASFRAMRATMNGRFEDAERFLNEARRISERAQDPNADRTLLIQRYGLLRAREDNDELLQLLPVLERAFDGMPNSSLYIAATIATILAREEHADQPWPAVDDSMLDEAIRLFDPTIVCHLGEMAAAREDVEMMARIATTLTSKQEHFAHWGLLGMTWEGPVSRYLALLADGMGKTQEADRLFGRAHDQCRALGTSPMAARTAYEHARSLADRGYGENRDRVISLLDAAERMATSLNLTALLGRISSLRRTFERPPVSSTDRPGVTTGVPAVGFLSLTQDGEAWTCVCEGDTFRLKHTKGVRMLATLLAEPGREFHVLDLTDTRRSGESMDSGDAGEMLDATARAQYQRRVEELRGELEEAEAWNDPSRAQRAREELDRIATELSRAFGLGGRERRSGSAAERARVNVQRRLRDAVKRIEQHSPAAAKHLSWALKTGTYCIYDPN